jgi:integrase
VGTIRLFKRGAVYWTDLRTKEGREKESTGEKQREAAARIARQRLRLAEARQTDGPGPTLRDVLESWVIDHVALLESGNSRRSAESTVRRLLVELGALAEERVSGVRQLQVDRFAAQLRGKLKSRSTVAKRMRHLRAAVRWAERHGMMPPAPFRIDVRPPRPQPVALSPEEIRRLFAAAPEGRVRLAMLLAATCGLRHSELVRLKVSDFRGNALSVREAKADSDRVVPVPEPAAEAISEWIARCNRQPDWPLLGHHRAPWRRVVRLSKSVQRAFVAAGLWRVELKPGLHALRRSCATHMLGSGADLRTVMSVLGWRNLATPMHYLASVDGKKREASEKLALVLFPA